MADRRKQRTRSDKVSLRPQLIIEKRKQLTPAQRRKLIELKGNICKWCSKPIAEGERWTDEHWIPLGQGGKNSWDNRFPLHTACAREKTNGMGGDNSTTAKCKRIERTYREGRALSRNPLPGGKRSGWVQRLTSSGPKWERRVAATT